MEVDAGRDARNGRWYESRGQIGQRGRLASDHGLLNGQHYGGVEK